MSVAFIPGQEIGRGDLDIFITDDADAPVDPAEITYSIYYVDPDTALEVLIGAANRTPINPAVGEYYAALQVPTNANVGDYRIRWTFRELVTDIYYQQVLQEFAVVAETYQTDPLSQYNAMEQDLIRRLRILLRDHKPDRNYRFRPPEHEGTVGQYNQVFGFVWEDEELYEYLQMGLWYFNSLPPDTNSQICSLTELVTKKQGWIYAVMWAAIIYAMFALMTNWTQDEFDYSIGGISLNIDKSSKFEALKRNAEEQLDKAGEAKARTTKYMRGLTQPRFGIGVRSAFGPHVGRGVLGPRNFI